MTMNKNNKVTKNDNIDTLWGRNFKLSLLKLMIEPNIPPMICEKCRDEYKTKINNQNVTDKLTFQK